MNSFFELLQVSLGTRNRLSRMASDIFLGEVSYRYEDMTVIIFL